jgi:Zn-dependent peptidase ImmA (M78 family)/transcriptional regulator with XRE-family HTH domain
MSKQVVGINPKVLEWARIRSGQSLDDVAAAFGKDLEVIRAWESGESAPTYVQLEKLAYTVYKRPIAIFFFPTVPEEIDPEHSFRTLPETEIEELGADTRHKVREARAMQLSLAELAGANPSSKQLLKDISAKGSEGIPDFASSIREYLGVPLAVQKNWKSVEDALKTWRAAIEDAGIFVFKDSFKQKDVFGFSLYDSAFPVIFINNSSASTRQLFTLFHELAHLVVHESGVTKRDDRYIEKLQGRAHQIEVFCNRLAAELLVPSADFKAALQGYPNRDEQAVTDLARTYKVSREVILRRMLDMGLVSKSRYEHDVKKWADDYEAKLKADAQAGKKGGNYYATQASYLGEKYLSLAFSSYYRGKISVEQLADYLNVSVKNVAGLEQFVLQKTGG